MCAEDIMGVPSRGDDIIQRSLLAIQANPRLDPYATPVIFIIEGVGGDTMWLGPKFLDTAHDLHMNAFVIREMKEGPNGPGFGVPKNAMITASMVTSVSGVLAEGLVSIPADCVAVSSVYSLPPKTIQDQCTKLGEQLTAFRMHTDDSVNGKGGGQNDDLVISFMMAIHWSQVFCQSRRPEVVMYRNAQPHLNDIWMSGAIATFKPNRGRN